MPVVQVRYRRPRWTPGPGTPPQPPLLHLAYRTPSTGSIRRQAPPAPRHRSDVSSWRRTPLTGHPVGPLPYPDSVHQHTEAHTMNHSAPMSITMPGLDLNAVLLMLTVLYCLRMTAGRAPSWCRIQRLAMPLLNRCRSERPRELQDETNVNQCHATRGAARGHGRWPETLRSGY